MRRLFARFLFVWALPCCVASDARAQFSALQTEHLRLVYVETTESYLVPHVARCFENAMQFQMRLFDYKPWEKTSVILTDFSDYGNAGATAVPRDALSVDIAPDSLAFETYPANERMNTMMNHELVHIMALDRTARRDRFFRHLFFGKVNTTAIHPETAFYQYLVTPRIASPRWYHEGMAVFVETWMAGGLGRAQGSYDEMVFRSMVRDGTPFYDPLGLVSEGTKVDFQLEANSYLYGTRFVSYLAYHYSPQMVLDWVARGDGTKAYYASRFEEVFGLPLDKVWSEWVAWEHEFQRANLDAIRQYPTTPYTDLSARSLGSVSRAHYDPVADKLYVAFNYPGVVAHVGAINLADGTVERIHEVKGPMLYAVTSLAWDPVARTLFYTSDNGSYRDLRSLDPASGKENLLLKDARIGDLVLNQADRSLWGIRHFNGLATIVRIPYPYDQWIQVHTLPYGTLVYDLDISPDGRLISASVGEISGRHTLRVTEIETLLLGTIDPVARVDFGTTIPMGFVFSPDGRYLYGSSYYTGAANIFRYEIATETLEAVSNTETGMFRPVPLGGDDLAVFRYSGQGFVPAKISAVPLQDISPITFLGEQLVEKHPVLKDWRQESPAKIPLDSLTTSQGDYKALRGMRLESAYPVVEGYKDSAAFGYHANFSDPLMFNEASLTASWSPDEDLPSDERLHFQARFKRHDWRAGFKWNDTDFYDLFGPTKVGLKGYSVSLGYTRKLIQDEPRVLEVSADVAYFGDLDRLPDYQNIEATYDRLSYASASLTWQNMRASIGAVEQEKGIRAGFTFSSSYVSGRYIPSVVADFDAGFPLPLRNSSLWLRTAIGTAFGDLDDPFANFFFGGFGNNWVDHGSIKRYHDIESFPGANLNAIGGMNFVRSMLEWNLPPLRFKRVGRPGFYATWARGSFFVGGIETNLDETDERRKLADAGAQIDMRFTMLSRLDMTLSVGYAMAFERDQERKEEFMTSLKILR